MKNCDHYSTLFSDFIDDNLDDQARSVLKGHLDSCPACTKKLNEMQAIKHTLALLPHVKTSESFDILLQARIRREMRQKQIQRRSFPLFELNWKIPAYAAAALCLVFFGAVLQRFSSSSYLAKESEALAIENVLRTDIATIEPGHMVLVEIDTVNNRYRIINYGGIDNVYSRQDLRKMLSEQNDDGMRTGLPNLKTAPQSKSLIMQTSQDIPQVRQAQFIF